MNRQMYEQTDVRKDRCVNRQMYKETDVQTDRLNRQMCKQTDGQTDRRIDMQIEWTMLEKRHIIANVMSTILN